MSTRTTEVLVHTSRPKPPAAAGDATFDIGDGPLAQSILALSSSSVVSTCLIIIAYLVSTLLLYSTHAVPTTLAAVESSPDAHQPLKKSDDQSHVPFDQEEKIQAAFRKATTGHQETAAGSTTLTSSLRRTLRYWLTVRGGIGGILYGFHLSLLSITIWWIMDQAGDAASRKLQGLKIEQSLPWYISAKIVLNAPKAFIRVISSLLTMPLGIVWTWHILRWRTSSLHSHTHWPPLRQLISVRGIWLLIRQIPPPILPSKRNLRYMLLPTLISSMTYQIGKFYPESMIHILFVSINGANARPNTLVATAILAESTTTTVVFYILPNLTSELLTRMQASVFPEDEQSIVPLDRTFGVKPKPGQGPGITLTEAWTTMSWSTLARIVKMHIKTMALFYGILAPIGLVGGAGKFFVDGVQRHHREHSDL